MTSRDRVRARCRASLAPGRALLTRAVAVLPVIDGRLRERYGDVPFGSAPLGNKRNPLDELVFIQLSVRTRESGYLGTYPALRRLTMGRWERLLHIPDREVLEALAAGGMARLKLERLRGQILAIRSCFGRVTLAPLRRMSDESAEAFLRSLPGVGPKVARCVLLYSLDRDVFPVDSNCHRVFARLGFLPGGLHIKAGHDFLHALAPPKLRRSLHVNLVRHGRELCRPQAPRCSECPLLTLCPTGQMRLRQAG